MPGDVKSAPPVSDEGSAESDVVPKKEQEKELITIRDLISNSRVRQDLS